MARIDPFAFWDATSLAEVTFLNQVILGHNAFVFAGPSPLKTVYAMYGDKDNMKIVFEASGYDIETLTFKAICTVTFHANGGTCGEVSRTVIEGETVGDLPDTTYEGYTLKGWFTALEGGEQVAKDTVVTADVTFYAQWVEDTTPEPGPDPDPTPDPEPTPEPGPEPEPTPEPGPEPEPTPEPEVEPTTWTVSFDANGGGGSMAAQLFTNGVARTLNDAAFTLFGYKFVGWAASADGDVVFKDGQMISPSSSLTLYAVWEEIAAGQLDTAFAKAKTVLSALYGKDGALVGTVQVKVGKLGKKGVKISASATLLVDGKAKKVSAKAVSLPLVGGALSGTLVFKAPIGAMSFEMTADGAFTLKNADYVAEEATIGSNGPKVLAQGSHTFFLEEFGLPVAGDIQEQLLPTSVVFAVSGKKWKFDKGASVKWTKNKVTKEYGLVVDTSKGRSNLSALKLSYAPKTGVFKGSFKIYMLETSGAKTKLKSYKANVLGFVVDAVGIGEARCKKPVGGPWAVTVK